jgi:hypothetical protein
MLVAIRDPPAWATALVEYVVVDHHREDFPILIWKGRPRGNGPQSSGLSKIEKELKRHVLLHEFTHWLVGNREKHSIAFYRMLFELVDHYARDQLDASVRRGSRYKPRYSRIGLAAFSHDKCRGRIIRPPHVPTPAMAITTEG